MDRVAIKEKVMEFLKKYRYALLILLLGLALMCLPESTDETEPTQTVIQAEETGDMEQRLEKILSQIDGAGKVSVLLTVRTGESVVYQTDGDTSVDADGSTERKDTVIISDAARTEQGLVRQVNPPVYLGAVVVCQGADRATVRLAIVEAVSNATGLGADRITVLKMK